MDAQREAPDAATSRGARIYQNESAQLTRKRPAFAKTFCPGQNGFAVLCVGWPPVFPPAGNVLALPPDESPTAIDWRLLKGRHVFVTPTPGAQAPRDVLRELGAELAAAGAASVTIFDGGRVLADWWRAGRPKVTA